MSFRLGKTPKNFTCEVSVTTSEGEEEFDWKFRAEFKVLTDGDRVKGKANIIDDALIAVSGVPVEEGITPDEVLAIIKDRPDTRAALVKAYNLYTTKKNQGLSLLG